MVALRDDVLREEFRAKRREKLWEVVRGLVEGNANVRTMVREGRSGEVSRVWEWIGAVQRIEGGVGAGGGGGGSAQKRVSGVGRIAGSPVGRMSGGVGFEDGSGFEEGSSSLVAGGGGAGGVSKKWEEGRVYY